MQLRAVLFDLWGTLIIDPEHRSQPRTVWRAENVAAVLGRAGVAVTAERALDALSKAGVELSALHDKGIDISAPGRVDLVLEHLGQTAALPGDAREELQAAICTMHPVHRPEPAPFAVESIRSVRELGLKTALVSNAGLTTAPSLRLMLDEYGLAPYLDACVFSDELELAKPNPRLFLDALDALGVEPPDAAFVGDSPHNDIFGARQAGLLAVQIGHREAPPRTGYTESDGARPNAYITQLSELLPAIAEFAALPKPAR